MSLGQLVKQSRIAKGYTQRRLASFVECHYSYISKLENNNLEFMPSEDFFIRIAQALEIDPDMVILHFGKVPKKYQNLLIELSKKYGNELYEKLSVL